jgi:hypothetical protein
MINKDIVYIVCFILIIINCILYKKTKPVYINTPIFKILFLICTILLSYLNIYIGTFLGITFLTIYQ